MKPYFDDGQVTLYHGDCREITEWLTADVLVTDPPYGRRWQKHSDMPVHGRRSKRAQSHRGITGDHDTGMRDAALAAWAERGPAACFGDLLIPAPADAKQVLIYRKPSDAGAHGAVGGFRRDVEGVYLIGPWPTGIGGRSSVLTTNARIQGSDHGTAARAGHPHAKPVDLLEGLILASPPGIIADPFAGSGSTLTAARNLGRRAIGVELEEKYCEAAARRLSQLALDFEAAS